MCYCISDSDCLQICFDHCSVSDSICNSLSLQDQLYVARISSCNHTIMGGAFSKMLVGQNSKLVGPEVQIESFAMQKYYNLAKVGGAR